MRGWSTAGAVPARADEVRLLARACLLAGLVTAVTAAVPFSPTAHRDLGAVLAAVGIGLGVALHRGAGRVAVRTVHAVLTLATALITLCVATATTHAGLQVTSLAYVWVGLYSATVHPRREVAGHLALVGTGFAVALAVAGAPSAPQTWFFVMATVTGVAWVLSGKVARLRGDAMRDSLTGTLTRRAFTEVAEREMARAVRHGEPLTLALLDLDDFKRVNDERGHAAGDAVLVGLTSAWWRSLRRGDALGRLGGDEFALLLPGAGPAETRALLDRLRAADDTCGWSSGVATWTGQDLDGWLADADADLYRRKVGRSR